LIKEHQVLILMLLLALAFGIIFIFLVPPWQHYDEPTQFEFSWMISNHPGNPESGDFDQALRREIAASMIENDFFRDLGFKPNLLSVAEQIWIGISQIGSKSLYYWVVALPLRLVPATDVTFQLYVSRFVSLFFYLVSIIAAYGFAVEISPEKHPVRWLLPLSILLLPGFVDIMTAINDDVAATAFFSLFLWTGTRMMLRGFNWLRLLSLIVLAILCFYTKNTVIAALLLAPLPLLVSLTRPGYKRYIWIGLGICGILGVLLVFNFGFPRSWYLENGAPAAYTTVDEQAPWGKKVFNFGLSEGSPPVRVSQLIPRGTSDRTKTEYTLGAWIWADQAAVVRTPILHTTNKDAFRIVEVDREPRFFAFSETVGAQSRPYKVSLSPIAGVGDQTLKVYYDGVILLQGEWQGEIPQFENASGNKGSWKGAEFTNLIRNSSSEYSSFILRSPVASALLNLVPGNPNLTLGLLQDPTPLVPYYQSAIKMLLHTFWARFGWAQVTLIGYRPYAVLGLFSLAGLVGAVVAFWNQRRNIRWELFIFLGLSLISLWGAALVRGVTSYIDGGYFIPVARYAYPAILPTMLILNIGWLEITRWIEKLFKIPRKYQIWGIISIFLILDIVSVISISSFFRG
jgi:hypothetical protein